MKAFDQVGDALVPAERRELLHLVVENMTAEAGRLRIAFHDFEEANLKIATGKAIRGTSP